MPSLSRFFLPLQFIGHTVLAPITFTGCNSFREAIPIAVIDEAYKAGSYVTGDSPGYISFNLNSIRNDATGNQIFIEVFLKVLLAPSETGFLISVKSPFPHSAHLSTFSFYPHAKQGDTATFIVPFPLNSNQNNTLSEEEQFIEFSLVPVSGDPAPINSLVAILSFNILDKEGHNIGESYRK